MTGTESSEASITNVQVAHGLAHICVGFTVSILGLRMYILVAIYICALNTYFPSYDH